ncbi:MAG: DUF4468 domain-containing protein [Chitinophagaceae bacterium]|nr:MAG: DUF4468 domain-containing protein [Chitinophagaceae bacterium]
MKKFYLIAFIIFFSVPDLQAQTEDAVAYKGIIEVPGTTKEELFIRSRQWLTETFNSARFFVYIEDKETGELTGRGNIWVNLKFGIFKNRHALTFCPMTYNIWVKDGKLKFSFTDFQVDLDTLPATFPFRLTNSKEKSSDYYGGGLRFRRLYTELDELVEQQMQKLISSLEAKVKGPASNDF